MIEVTTAIKVFIHAKQFYNVMEDVGPLELEILKILWKKGRATSSDIREELGRRLATTTISTTLSRMYRKGLLDREIRTGRGGVIYVYKPKISREDLARKAAKTLVEKLGSAALMALVREGAKDLTPGELEELLGEIERLKRQREKNEV